MKVYVIKLGYFQFNLTIAFNRLDNFINFHHILLSFIVRELS